MTISTIEEFGEWLETQPREVCVAIAYRAAMRVLPLAALVLDGRDEWAEMALTAFRACLTSGVVAAGPSSVEAVADLVNAAIAAHISAGDAARDAGDYASADAAARAATDVAAGAAAAAWSVEQSSQDTTGYAAYPARYATPYTDADAAVWPAARSAVYADTALTPGKLAKSAIPAVPDVAADIAQLAKGKIDLLASGGPWAFWAEWYARAMAGDPLPWALQEKIALIPDAIWKAGPEAVAAEIERIEAAFRLRERIAEMEEDQVHAEDARFGIGGNNPPVEIDDPEVGRQMVILWDSVSGLKEEVEADEPDARRVSEHIERLKGVLRDFLSYCGRKLDLAVDTTIKWGIPVTGSYLVLNPSKAEAVLKAAQDWLPFLAP
ncbi:hypothetical protein [Roseicyclus sp.]|uniref:hypothetical protein n=1 Tax=Roseicyclus sp. TaxID=1914329 RepID=UPI003FA112E7